MENATKALIIVVAAMLAIILLTFLSYSIKKFGQSSSSTYNLMDKSRITEFNQKYLNYDTTERKDRGDQDIFITAQDVATIININKDNTKRREAVIKIDIKVYDKTKTLIYDSNKTNPEDEFIIMEHLDSKYECEAKYEDENGNRGELIRRVKINEVP